MGFTLKTELGKPFVSAECKAPATMLCLMGSTTRRAACLLQLAQTGLTVAGITPVDSRQALSDLRAAPVWLDPNPVGSLRDGHYHVRVTLPAGASVNSSAVVDVDFAALPGQPGISGSLDGNSPRVVRVQ